MLSSEVLKILDSPWVQSKEDDWGYELKDGAPEDIKKQFAEYEATFRAIHASAKQSEE